MTSTSTRGAEAALAEVLSSTPPSSSSTRTRTRSGRVHGSRDNSVFDDDDVEDDGTQEVLIPLDSPSNIPHPASRLHPAADSSMRSFTTDSWHTPVRVPHPPRRTSFSSSRPRASSSHNRSTAGFQSTPHSPNASISIPASSKHHRRHSPPFPALGGGGGTPSQHHRSPSPPLPLLERLSSSPSTPAFFLESFGKDATPGRRAAAAAATSAILKPDNDSRDDDANLLIASPIEELAPRDWPSFSAADGSQLASNLGALQLEDRQGDQADGNEEEHTQTLEKSPYDSPPARLEGLFEGLPPLSSPAGKLPDDFQFGNHHSQPRRVGWLRADADAPFASDGRARSEADATNQLPDVDEDEDGMGGEGDDNDDEDDRASIASSLLSLPVSIVTTASGGNNSRFLEEQQQMHQQAQRERERERGQRANSTFGASRRGLGLNLGVGIGSSGNANTNTGSLGTTSGASLAKDFFSALSSKRPTPGAGFGSRGSPARHNTSNSISFASPPSMVGSAAGDGSAGGEGNASSSRGGRRSRAASLLSGALPLVGGQGGTADGAGAGAGGGGGGAAAAVASWKRRGLAALTSSPPQTAPSAPGGAGQRRGSVSASASPTPSPPALTFSSLAPPAPGGGGGGGGGGSGSATPSPLPSSTDGGSMHNGTSSYFFAHPAPHSGAPSAGGAGVPMSASSSHTGSGSLSGSNSGSGTGAGTHSRHPSAVPHRPASILLKPSTLGAAPAPANGPSGLLGGGTTGSVSRPQSTTSTQSGGSSGGSLGGGGGGSALGPAGRRLSESSGGLSGSRRMLGPAVRLLAGGGGSNGGGGSTSTPASSTPGGTTSPHTTTKGGHPHPGTSTSVSTHGSGSGPGPGVQFAPGLGPIFTREVRIGGWTYVGQKASGWAEFQVRVLTLKGTTICASRRFSSFVALRKQLAKDFPQYRTDLPELPSRRHGLLHRYSPTHLEQRRLHLQRWLHRVLRDPRFGGSEAAREFVLGGVGVGVGVGLGVGLGLGTAVAGVAVDVGAAPEGVGGAAPR